jgi:hypothetical protein
MMIGLQVKSDRLFQNLQIETIEVRTKTL